MPRSWRMSGNATFTMLTSSTTMNCATQTTARIRPVGRVRDALRTRAMRGTLDIPATTCGFTDAFLDWTHQTSHRCECAAVSHLGRYGVPARQVSDLGHGED